MSLIDISTNGSRPIFYPAHPSPPGSDASGTMDALDEPMASVFIAHKTATIHKIHIYLTSSNMVGTLTAGLYGIDASGYTNAADPKGGMVAGTLANPSAGWNTVTLGTDCSIEAGTLYSALFKVTAYTSGSAVCAMRYLHPSYLTDVLLQMPHGENITNYQPYMPTIVLEELDGTLYPIPNVKLHTSTTNINFSSSTTPDEYANKITVPFGCRVIGVAVNWDRGTGPDGVGTLYIKNSSGTALASSTSPKSSIYPNNNKSLLWWNFTPIELTAGQVVYAGYLPGASARTWYQFDYASSALRALDFPNTILVGRADAGAWTEDDTKALPIALVIDQLDLTSTASTSCGAVNTPVKRGVRI